MLEKRMIWHFASQVQEANFSAIGRI